MAQERRRFLRRQTEAFLVLDLDTEIAQLKSEAIDVVARKLAEGQGTETDFGRAWRLQEERDAGRSLPRTLVASDALSYAKIASLGTQLERLLGLFARERVCLVFADEFAEDPRREYGRVLAFLGVPDDGRSDFPPLNPSRHRHWPALARLLRHPMLRRPAMALKRRLGVRGFGVGKLVDRLTVEAGRPPLDPALRAELERCFEPEFEKLARLTGRDLREPAAPPGSATQRASSAA